MRPIVGERKGGPNEFSIERKGEHCGRFGVWMATTMDGVIRFFLLAVGITWTLQFPGVLAQKGMLPGSEGAYLLPVFLGILGPTLAAYWVRRRDEPDLRFRDLFRSPSAERPSISWLLGALLLPSVTLTGALIAHRLAGGSLPLAYFPDPPGRLLVGVIIATAEEIGWRGFALPRLSRALGRVLGTLVLSLVWTIWHVPMFLGQGISLELLPLMFAFFFAGSLVFTWVYYRTGGSLLACVLLHLGAHVNNSHLPLPGDSTPLMLHTCAWGLTALGLLVFDKRTFFPEVTGDR